MSLDRIVLLWDLIVDRPVFPDVVLVNLVRAPDWISVSLDRTLVLLERTIDRTCWCWIGSF